MGKYLLNVKKKLCGPFLWMGFNYLKAIEGYRATTRRHFIFYQFPELTGTHLIDLGKMKGRVYLGAT